MQEKLENNISPLEIIPLHCEQQTVENIHR